MPFLDWCILNAWSCSSIYLWWKVVCFVLNLWDSLNQDTSDHVLCVFWKLSMSRGPWAWFHDNSTSGAKVFQHWTIFSLQIKLNCSEIFWRNWNVPFMLLERSWWARFNGIYLVRFGFRMWEILNFKWFLLLKIQINSKKPGEINSSMISFHIWLFKKSLHTLQDNVYMFSFPIV